LKVPVEILETCVKVKTSIK